jgi:catechol 2,3-dioxygenase-like lactoylglutathione lyase family enzyme
VRLQLALNVRDIEEAVSFYSKLFDTQPHKLKEGYANFAIDKPSLKLVLIENAESHERINHLGVELKHNEALNEVTDRLNNSGMIDKTEDHTNCCYAVQDKVWSIEPQGLHWEWYTITDDAPVEANSCCNSNRDACCT